MASETTKSSTLETFAFSRRKGGTLKKIKKSQSDQTKQVVSVNDLFGGKRGSGGFGAPVMDMAASFTSTGSGTSSLEDFAFKADNPMYSSFINNEEDDEENKEVFTSGIRPKRWTFGSFLLRRTSEKA